MKKILILFIFISSSLFSQKERWDNASKELVDLYKSAYEKYSKNEIQESINDLTIAIEIDSNYRSAYAFRGQLYKSQKLYSKAFLDYSKALEISDYNSYRTLKDIGYIRFELKEYDESFKIFNKLEKKDGVDIGTKYMRAISAYYLEDYETAIEGFNKSIIFDHQEGNWLGYKGETKACYYRANSKLKLNKYEEAIKDYNLVISREKSPYKDKAYYERGFAKKKLNLPYQIDFYKSCELGYEIACYRDSSRISKIKLPDPDNILKISFKKLFKKLIYSYEDNTYQYKGLVLKIDKEQFDDGWIPSIEIKASSITSIYEIVRFTVKNACIPSIITTENKNGIYGGNSLLIENDPDIYGDEITYLTLLNFNEIKYIEIYEDECGIDNIDLIIEFFNSEN
jgi:tetratricopeptide (TPR) repeat protein